MYFCQHHLKLSFLYCSGQHVHRHTSGGLERGPRQRQHGGQVPVRENHHSPHHSAQFPLR